MSIMTFTWCYIYQYKGSITKLLWLYLLDTLHSPFATFHFVPTYPVFPEYLQWYFHIHLLPVSMWYSLLILWLVVFLPEHAMAESWNVASNIAVLQWPETPPEQLCQFDIQWRHQLHWTSFHLIRDIKWTYTITTVVIHNITVSLYTCSSQCKTALPNSLIVAEHLFATQWVLKTSKQSAFQGGWWEEWEIFHKQSFFQL